MTFFIKQAKQITLAAVKPEFTCYNELPAGTYAVKNSMDIGYYLEIIDDFEIPTKLYGDCTKHRDRILSTFEDRPHGTGVFLEGEKGSGKTLLAKALSLRAIEKGVPTIVVNSPFCGESFNTFIQSIKQPCVMIFDEFEKIYSEDHQPLVLTLFDGVYPSKKLFIVTCNDSWRVSGLMHNRPGRLYYMLTFDGLDRNFIREYAEDNLTDKSQVDGILSVSTLFGKFNFDMLKAMVEEMNRYGESAKEVIKLLNTKPKSREARFDVTVFIGGVPIVSDEDGDTYVTDVWHGNPLEDDVRIDIQTNVSAGITKRKLQRVFFKPEHLTELNGQDGTFTYVNGKTKLVLTEPQTKEVDWTQFVAG